MASSSDSRSTFIQSAIDYLQEYGFDGIDIDWEYPTQRGGSIDDKANFATLLQEMRQAFDPYGYIITAAVAGGKSTIDAAYDVPAMSQSLDFINVMSYAYHGSWDNFTNLNTPLFPRPSDSVDNQELTVNFTMNYWISLGADPSKLVLGMSAYGIGWALQNPSDNGIGAPTTGLVPGGPILDTAGNWGYNEICLSQQSNAWTVVVDPYYLAPYTYLGTDWLGYDDPASLEQKAYLINELNLGGGMVWSIDTDDFSNLCGAGDYPLLKSIRSAMDSGINVATPASE